MASQTINLGIVGDRKTGKSTFVEIQHQGNLITKYEETKGEKMTALYPFVDGEMVTMNIFEHPNPSTKLDGVIIFFSFDDEESFSRIVHYSEHDTKHMVICGNKCDLEKKKIPLEKVKAVIHSAYKVPFYEISCYEFTNLMDPLKHLVKSITGKKITGFKTFQPEDISDKEPLVIHHK